MGRIIGLLPAAGQARRLSTLPCSKEIFPVGFREVTIGNKAERYPMPVSQYLIDRMVLAGVDQFLIVVGKEKWDILRYYGSGAIIGKPVSFIVQDQPLGMPDALDQGYPWIKDDVILFGMPDTIFQPKTAYLEMLNEFNQTSADLVLGLFPTRTPERFGMAQFDDQNRLILTVDKPKETRLHFMWGIGCWGPVFTEFMHAYLSKVTKHGPELVLAQIFQAAVDEGLDTRVVPFGEGEYVDIGTFDDLAKIICRYSTTD